jgi:hypothetical protein
MWKYIAIVILTGMSACASSKLPENIDCSQIGADIFCYEHGNPPNQDPDEGRVYY